jgi:hypothetical protein
MNFVSEYDIFSNKLVSLTFLAVGYDHRSPTAFFWGEHLVQEINTLVEEINTLETLILFTLHKVRYFLSYL